MYICSIKSRSRTVVVRTPISVSSMSRWIVLIFFIATSTTWHVCLCIPDTYQCTRAYESILLCFQSTVYCTRRICSSFDSHKLMNATRKFYLYNNKQCIFWRYCLIHLYNKLLNLCDYFWVNNIFVGTLCVYKV